MDIDTLGTFNMSRVLYEKFFRVSVLLSGGSPLWQSLYSLTTLRVAPRVL